VILAARGIAKRYAAFDAVIDVDLAVGPGEFGLHRRPLGSGKVDLARSAGAR